MRVFITGATGFIGSAVVEELIGAGHQVIGLARSDAGAKQLTAAGAGVQRGSLEDLDSLKRGAAESEGVIHLAFHHDFTDFAASCAKDRAAIETLGGVLAGSNRPLVVSSGVLGLAQGRPGTEEDVPAHAFPRKSEETGLSFASKGVRASVIRLSPSVHGDGDHGFVPQLINDARARGFASYIGDGKNRWPAVHRLDAARLYRLALEKGTAGGRYHGVAEEGVPIRDIAEIIGKRLCVPAVSKSAEEVVGALGLIGQVLAMDAPSSSKLTQERLGWRPTQPGLIADLERGTYFDAK
ncbi:SDR family oxidoreductase [Sorangium sp. So ce1078]|uniref:SDR family oxidoreductase n=1 Tax=Sorangium sp. So ce1078 TaxID=3133329 RepID=UPI003F5F7646